MTVDSGSAVCAIGRPALCLPALLALALRQSVSAALAMGPEARRPLGDPGAATTPTRTEHAARRDACRCFAQPSVAGTDPFTTGYGVHGVCDEPEQTWIVGR